MELLYDTVIPLLGISPKNTETLTRKNICTPMFIVALFTIAKVQKQPKCPSVDEWDIYTMEFYVTIRKKDFLPSWYGSVD